MAFTLYIRAPGEKRRPPRGLDAVVHLDEPGRSGYPLHHRLEHLLINPQVPSESVMAFLMAALGVWSADKFAPRSAAPDAWTREIVLSLPAPSPWTEFFPRLALLLNFLTGDRWTLNGRDASLNLGFSGHWPHSWLPQAVALFSGGLDSLVGAIDLLEAGERIVLVSHYDFGQLASIQQSLTEALQKRYGPDRLHHLALRVQFPESPELTLRSRSLLYLALGLTMAAAFGEEMPLIVPENGWISLNPPLTLNRLGPYSTRTTHPYFLEQLATLWRQAGINHPLINPYQRMTKGEMLEQCRNREILTKLFPLTISCARPEVGRWQGWATGACGYCYPCLMRRAALNRLGWDEAKDYRVDMLADPEIRRHRVKGGDLRALLYSLKTWEDSPRNLEARLWLAGSSVDLPEQWSEARHLLKTGFAEIYQLLEDKGLE